MRDNCGRTIANELTILTIYILIVNAALTDQTDIFAIMTDFVSVLLAHVGGILQRSPPKLLGQRFPCNTSPPLCGRLSACIASAIMGIYHGKINMGEIYLSLKTV